MNRVLISILIILVSIGFLLIRGSLTTGLNPIEYIVETLREIKDKLLDFRIKKLRRNHEKNL